MSEPQTELDRADVMLRAADGGVVAAIPQFGLFARGTTVQTALAALEEKKAAVQADFAAFSALSDVSPVQAAQSIRWGPIKEFAIKMGIVFALLLGTLIYSATKLEDIVQRASNLLHMEVQRAFAQLDTRSFWKNLETELAKAAGPTRDLPPEKKQKILSDIRTIVERWRPFVAEASAIFSPNSSPPAQPTSQ